MDGAYQYLKERATEIVNQPHFENAVHSLVVLNAIILSIDHFPASMEFVDTMDAINFILVIAFTFELICKVLAFGWLSYLSNEFNVLDFAVVVLSWTETATSPPHIFGGDLRVSGSAAAIRAMRLFRMFRLFKVMSRNKKLKVILEKLVMTGEDLRNFGVPLVFLVFMYSIIGMNLYANKLRFDENGYAITKINSEEWKNAEDHPVHNYDDFPHAFGSVFQVLRNFHSLP